MAMHHKKMVRKLGEELLVEKANPRLIGISLQPMKSMVTFTQIRLILAVSMPIVSDPLVSLMKYRK